VIVDCRRTRAGLSRIAAGAGYRLKLSPTNRKK
jgi:hypothetical protein